MKNPKKEQTYQLWGWYLFIISALFFTTASILNGDWFGLLGALAFLIACFLFIIPLRSKQSE